MNITIHNSTGERIKKYRKEAHITQKELAEYLGITNSAVKNYEKGYRQPDAETLAKIADYLKVSIHSLLSRPFMNVGGLMNILLSNENHLGIHPEYREGQIVLAFTPKTDGFKHEYEYYQKFISYLKDWEIIYRKHEAKEISDSEYEDWKNKYPMYSTKITSDYLDGSHVKELAQYLCEEIDLETMVRMGIDPVDDQD